MVAEGENGGETGGWMGVRGATTSLSAQLAL
jgi:hypothetical protein